MSTQGREQWASRIGLVLAMAGNAIGLGNWTIITAGTIWCMSKVLKTQK